MKAKDLPERSWVKSDFNGRILFHTKDENFYVDDQPFARYVLVDDEESFRVLTTEETTICENSLIYVDSVKITGDSAKVVLKNHLGFKWKFDCKNFQLTIPVQFKTKDKRIPYSYARWNCNGGKIFDALKNAYYVMFSVDENGQTKCLISYEGQKSLSVPNQ